MDEVKMKRLFQIAFIRHSLAKTDSTLMEDYRPLLPLSSSFSNVLGKAALESVSGFMIKQRMSIVGNFMDVCQTEIQLMLALILSHSWGKTWCMTATYRLFCRILVKRSPVLNSQVSLTLVGNMRQEGLVIIFFHLTFATGMYVWIL